MSYNVLSGTGTSLQCFTGTGTSLQCFTGTGTSLQCFTGTGISLQCFIGTGTSLQCFIRYGDSYPDKDPNTINGPGDGTVNKRSLELCKQFKRLKDYKVVSGDLSTHLEILQRDDIIAYVAQHLLSDSYDTVDF